MGEALRPERDAAVRRSRFVWLCRCKLLTGLISCSKILSAYFERANTDSDGQNPKDNKRHRPAKAVCKILCGNLEQIPDKIQSAQNKNDSALHINAKEQRAHNHNGKQSIPNSSQSDSSGQNANGTRSVKE